MLRLLAAVLLEVLGHVGVRYEPILPAALLQHDAQDIPAAGRDLRHLVNQASGVSMGEDLGPHSMSYMVGAGLFQDPKRKRGRHRHGLSGVSGKGVLVIRRPHSLSRATTLAAKSV